MLRSLLTAIGAALVLVAVLSWQNIMSAGVSQVTVGWDKLLAFYNHEPVVLPGVVTDESRIAPLIPKIIEANVGLINAPYPETRTEGSRLTRRDGECEVPKANLDETAFFLRTNLFDPLSPVVVHHPRNARLAPELAQFFKDYGGATHKLSTNAAGERLTVPLVEGPRKVLVVGDSVAFGTALDDAETLASRLQSRDGTRQYVNLGIPDASAELILCGLAKAASRYRGQVDEIVYLYSEDDFAAGQRLGAPEAAVATIKGLAQSGSINKVTVVYAPSLYNIVPELTRYRGYAGENAPNPQAQREQLKKFAMDAGFTWLDIGEIALEQRRSQGDSFAVLGNFADPKNLSAQGISRLAEKFVLPSPPESAALAATAQEKPADGAQAGLEDRLSKQSAALDDIRAAAARAAKNNRLKREIGDILKKLKDQLAAEP